MSEPPTIRDTDHPYYAAEGNYFKAGCHFEYESWDDFMSQIGGADPDNNFVYRWDWHGQRLLVFFILQRKAICQSGEILVDSTDEPRIREWLEQRWERMRMVWAPISMPLEITP